MTADYLEYLTPAQRAAVEHLEGPALVIASPGSGKTRVITNRITHLLKHHRIKPTEIVAITFTNKAAREMKDRALRMLPKQIAERLMVSTFHALCARVLRNEHHAAGLPRNYTICDEDDTKAYMTQAVALVSNTDPKQINSWKNDYRHPRKAKWYISRLKQQVITPDDYLDELMHAGDVDERALFYGQVYERYQKILDKTRSVDFDDLIMRTVLLLREHEEIRQKYAKATRQLMVDECQDTNPSQYELVRQLASHHGNVTVVGDADQSIYRFRGATPRNLLKMEEDYGDTLSIFYLEENFRSTQPIADVANALIAYNKERKEKLIRPVVQDGDPVRCLEMEDNQQEAAVVVDEILQAVRLREATFGDYAILYRVHAHSRVFEELLVAHNVPHKVIGGVGFYNRSVVKDILAYLRLLMNGADEVAFTRIYNRPPRGFGDTSYGKFLAQQEERGVSVMTALRDRLYAEVLSGKPLAGIEQIRKLYVKLHSMDKTKVAPLVSAVVTHSGYQRDLENRAADEKAINKLQHLTELLTAAQEFDNTDGAGLRRFLEWTALMQSADEETDENRVHLMTCHAAKGLEFKRLYVVGAVRGLMPIEKYEDEFGRPKSSKQRQKDMEEERRVFFVALTRAERQLTVTHMKYSFRQKQVSEYQPSPFIEEMGDTVVHETVAGTPRGSYLLRALNKKRAFDPKKRKRRPKRRSSAWQ